MNPRIMLAANHVQDTAHRMVKTANTPGKLETTRCGSLVGRVEHRNASRSNEKEISHGRVSVLLQGLFSMSAS
jgi:hypothetical protein